MTAPEYFAMPETLQRQDLVDGEMIVAPAPALRHQRIFMRVAAAIDAFAREHGGEVIASPTDVELAEGVVLQPDTGYVAPNSAAEMADHIVGPPDLVVEILSPSERRGTHERKMEKYAAYGVREAWVVDPVANTVVVLATEAGRWVESARVAFGSPIPSSVVSVGDAGLAALG